jgi:hypothetical protein
MKALAITTLLALIVVIPFVGKKEREHKVSIMKDDSQRYQADLNRLYDIEDLLT